MEKILRKIEKLTPRKIYKLAQPAYHYALAQIGAIRYMYPSKHIHVIGITGTKGKSSTCEYVNAILEEAGSKTALLSTIRFKIDNESEPNMFKMTMPGRFFVQKFLRDAVRANCDYAVIEMTSEGARFYRNHLVEMDTLIFTNLTPEHIESHGSFEKYKAAKLSIAKRLEKSNKKNKRIVVNTTDIYGTEFLEFSIDKKLTYKEEDSISLDTALDGGFNKMNALAAKTLALDLGISEVIINRAIKNLKHIPGRVEHINMGQDFQIIIDYAHTPDSLEKLYKTYVKQKIIGLLGACGGGRDKAKRAALGEIADRYCDTVIITDEDPYDDNPIEIMNDVARGVTRHEPILILERRHAIHFALAEAIRLSAISSNLEKRVIVIISGKGTDPYIMRANHTKELWSDKKVTEEELMKLI
jgi:UDP-N-acetylmuramoyl-L-alanyl-D-glutamate--2,6-diaminopimelate ligase